MPSWLKQRITLPYCHPQFSSHHRHPQFPLINWRMYLCPFSYSTHWPGLFIVQSSSEASAHPTLIEHSLKNQSNQSLPTKKVSVCVFSQANDQAVRLISIILTSGSVGERNNMLLVCGAYSWSLKTSTSLFSTGNEFRWKTHGAGVQWNKAQHLFDPHCFLGAFKRNLPHNTTWKQALSRIEAKAC